jgi:hypothetical protein
MMNARSDRSNVSVELRARRYSLLLGLREVDLLQPVVHEAVSGPGARIWKIKEAWGVSPGFRKGVSPTP